MFNPKRGLKLSFCIAAGTVGGTHRGSAGWFLSCGGTPRKGAYEPQPAALVLLRRLACSLDWIS